MGVSSENFRMRFNLRFLDRFILLLAAASSISSGVAAGQSKMPWASPFVKGPKQSSFADKSYDPKKPSGPKWGDVKPDALGPEKVDYDTSGMRTLPPVPAAGVHPRILFTAAQIPDIRHRLMTTRVGKRVWHGLLEWIHAMKGDYDQNADYAKPDTFKGSFGTHGFEPIFRESAVRGGQIWKAFSEGKVDQKFKSTGGIKFIWDLFPLEALRCMVTKDTQGEKLLGRAIDTAILNYQKHPSNWKNDWFPGFNMAYTYDLAYHWMSPASRKWLHDWLASHVGTPHYGSLNPAITTVSNWATFTGDLTKDMAIEGEPGFNDLQYLGYLRAYRNFYTYGWYKSGACYEGMGKNQLGADALIMFSLRGENIAGHPHMLATYRNRFPKDILPGSDKYIAYGRWGGYRVPRAVDAFALKYLYPNDPTIDWVYRKAIGWDKNLHVGGRPDFSWNVSLIEAVCAQDPLPSHITQEQAAHGQMTFMGGQRNLFITRSSWKPDALYLNFAARPVNGGHIFADRNSFSFTGKGVNWCTRSRLR